ncbi:MAG: radical SAM protein [Promethearchaeota archaeon]
MNYLIENDKIQTETCELNICYHCNLNCLYCSHLSNKFKPFFLNPEQIGRDLSILSRFYEPQHVRLLGGESLLHPKIMDVIEKVRESNISKTIRVITNGILLNQIEDKFWKAIDEVYISIYPNIKIKPEVLTSFKNKADKFNVVLQLIHFDYFRVSTYELATKNKELIKRIYSTCQIAQIWRCHNIDNGYFYKCPQSLFIPKKIKGLTWNLDQDRVKISNNNKFKKELRDFLKSKEPLNACSYCLGSVGKLFPHKQANKNKENPKITEELIDWNFLKQLEKNPELDNGCYRFENDI